MNGRWNVDGPVTMTKIPAEFAEFVVAKRNQLLSNVVTSSLVGVVLANGVALLAGDASPAVLAETVQTQVPLYILTAIASFLAR